MWNNVSVIVHLMPQFEMALFMYKHTRICILIVASVRDYIQKGASMADTLEVEMIAEPHCVHVHHWEMKALKCKPSAHIRRVCYSAN